MKIKISGAEYKAIQAMPWPENWYVDDGVARVNGGEWVYDHPDPAEINDADVVEFDGGEICSYDDSATPRGGCPGYIKKKLAEMSERRIVVICQADKLDAVIAAVKSAGGRAA